jgi:hypothetical protein
MIYRFKIWFEELEDVVRWIDIKPTHTFFDFHNIILQSIDFKDLEPSSFFMSNDRWTKGLEITVADMGFEDTDEPKLLMKDSTLKDYINDPHQKFIYVYDFIEMWTLHIELQNILEDEKGKTYPNIQKSLGKSPKQSGGAGKFLLMDDLEMDDLANEILVSKGARTTDLVDIEDDLGFEEEEENEDDEFGPSYGDGYEEDSKDFF